MGDPPKLTKAVVQTALEVGPLKITWSSGMSHAWDDRKSGATGDVTFFRGPAGVCGAISRYVNTDQFGYVHLDDEYTMLPIFAGSDSYWPIYSGTGPAPFALATSMDPIWNSSGSSPRRSGSIWRPRHSSGDYVALTDYVCEGTTPPPPTNAIVIHKSFVSPARLGKNPIWTDAGSGAKQSVAIWPLITAGSNQLRACSSAFVAGERGGPLPPAWALDVAKLRGMTDSSGNALLSVVPENVRGRYSAGLVSTQYIPFYDIVDGPRNSSDGRTGTWSAREKIDRHYEWYYLETILEKKMVDSNSSTKSTSYTWGQSKTHAETFTLETGLASTVSATAGVTADLGSLSTTVEVSAHITATQATSDETQTWTEHTEEITQEGKPGNAWTIWQFQAARTLRCGADKSVVYSDPPIPLKATRTTWEKDPDFVPFAAEEARA